MQLRTGLRVGRAPQRWSLVTGFLALWLGTAAYAQSPAQPTAKVPWDQIDAGLAQVAAGDGQAAEAAFRKARSADDSGLAELLMDLTAAYVAYNRPVKAGGVAPWLRAEERLNDANKYFYRRHIPSTALGDTLTRVRKLLKQEPRESSTFLLRPLLCNLRLLSRDNATDGEPVLEGSGQSRDVGPLVFPRAVFAPKPPYPEAARLDKVTGSAVIGVVTDSEGCPVSAEILKPLPKGLADQALASWRWWAYEPTRYQGVAVGFKFTVTFGFMIGS
jgi:TonB family protein